MTLESDVEQGDHVVQVHGSLIVVTQVDSGEGGIWHACLHWSGH